MTAQTPAPKTSNVSALLASLSNVQPSPQPSVKEDFLALIQRALTSRPGSADDSPAAEPGREKPTLPDAAAPDLNDASMLLALLTPPLPILLKAPSHKVSAPSVRSIPAVPSVPLSSPTLVRSASETRPQRRDAAAALPAQSPPPKEPESKPPPTSGTPVANTSSGMSLRTERNEIAGKTEQKLPLAAVSAISSADTGGPSPDGGAKTFLSFTWQEAPSEQLAIINLSTKAASPVAPVEASVAEVPMRESSPAPLERLEQMISREVTSIRQTGAQTLGVALRLDSNTQLFLQLTTNNGLTQASVRCDSGHFAPEDTQWAQLQQSLARQNVELLPMTASSNLNFEQPSSQHQRQQAAREDLPASGAAVPPAQQRKQKEQNRSRKNWESWA